MKLRQSVEDFRVEEIAELDISKEEREFKIYRLEKRSIETFFLLRYLSKNNKIPISDFGIAGLKDKHAITAQYLSIPSKYELKTAEEKNFKLTFLGYSDKKIKIGDITANRFEITVRDLKRQELDSIKKRAESIEETGVPNYFDSQRFGSVINGKFIAMYVIKNEYEKAVKIFLTEYTKHEKSNTKNEKRTIKENWENIANLKIQNKLFSGIIEEYRKTGKWENAYKKIPYNLREMFLSAYQSYLWNLCIKEILKAKIAKEKLYEVKYNIGRLLFYDDVSKDELRRIPPNLNVINAEVTLNQDEKKTIERVLSKEGLRIEDFDIKEEKRNLFRLYERKTIVKPSNFRISSPKTDELNDEENKNRYKITLSFELPKGSYATIITKKIFRH